MPEGHVIHKLAHDLTSTFAGKTVEVTSPQGRFAHEASLLNNTTLISAEAFGKQLFIEFDCPIAEKYISIHLGLIGTFRFEPPEDTWGQIRLRITDNHTAANLRGPQWCRLISADDLRHAVDKLGADPLRDDADPTTIKHKILSSQRSIASLLMDQKYFPGVGNIYRAETLFRLNIAPTTPGNALSPDTFDHIWADLQQLMRYGVEHGRIDTVRPEHTPEAMGRKPRKDDHGGEVYVYRRHGQPCHICTSPISVTTYESRTLFWCPSCQN
ncbi:MAG: DNA-formamidopyrimidine glycosylase family protein [Corynebacterium sp.]|uniref:Fpg/Nei family DNA glycosylase n=1 Tax=Corynebacterium sp. TaxID=1720 RepID=UPI0026DBF471|nr:DNA-formamidopyrimidine glycosylase family protein [Corynebacterium sp.]MDO4761615.1 DNA-formamidopyrimidine glycosylase family protein [Corynebacterium sp.]